MSAATFAAVNTGNNALYIGLTFMPGCLLLSGVASKGGWKHLDVELRGLDEAWAGRPADAIPRITNRGAGPVSQDPDEGAPDDARRQRPGNEVHSEDFE